MLEFTLSGRAVLWYFENVVISPRTAQYEFYFFLEMLRTKLQGSNNNKEERKMNPLTLNQSAIKNFLFKKIRNERRIGGLNAKI